MGGHGTTVDRVHTELRGRDEQSWPRTLKTLEAIQSDLGHAPSKQTSCQAPESGPDECGFRGTIAKDKASSLFSLRMAELNQSQNL
jgi:hypothetical protein